MSTLNEKDARELHERVLRDTLSMLKRWLIVISINFFAHYMRMGISLSYMTHELGASELSAGAVVTSHLALIGLANAYLSFSMDTHSFETMITVRFGLLVLATLAEWLAQDFIQFAVAYILASLAIVWISVADGYFVQLLPSEEAKLMCTLAGTINRVSCLIGLALGGTLAGMVSFGWVFFSGFIVSVASLIFILFSVLGREQQIKKAQSEEILTLYMKHPHWFPESDRFPMPFVDAHKLLSSSLSQSFKANNDQSSVFCTAPGIPLALFILFIGLQTALKLEVIAWWNVYAMQVMDESIALSNAQMIVSTVSSVLGLIVSAKLLQTHSMPVSTLLKWSVAMFTLTEFVSGMVHVLILPSLQFAWFWLAWPMMSLMDGMAAPLRYSLQVIESPVHESGSIFAATILSRSLIPAMQHIIIGALWKQGGPSHPWFFRWFGIVHLFAALVFLVYWIAKEVVLSLDSKHKESPKDYGPYAVIP